MKIVLRAAEQKMMWFLYHLGFLSKISSRTAAELFLAAVKINDHARKFIWLVQR